MARTGYILDNNFDLIIENGSFAKGDITDQSIQMIAIGMPGFLRQYPEMGFNAIRYHKSKADKKQKFESELRAQLENNGFKVNSTDLSDPEWWGKFVIEAE